MGAGPLLFAGVGPADLVLRRETFLLLRPVEYLGCLDAKI